MLTIHFFQAASLITFLIIILVVCLYIIMDIKPLNRFLKKTFKKEGCIIDQSILTKNQI